MQIYTPEIHVQNACDVSLYIVKMDVLQRKKQNVIFATE